jgi:aurora kinase
MFPVPGNRTPCLNDFVVGKKLGKGKFGEVFLVKHKHIGFICAMKVLSKTVIK